MGGDAVVHGTKGVVRSIGTDGDTLIDFDGSLLWRRVKQDDFSKLKIQRAFGQLAERPKDVHVLLQNTLTKSSGDRIDAMLKLFNKPVGALRASKVHIVLCLDQSRS